MTSAVTNEKPGLTVAIETPYRTFDPIDAVIVKVKTVSGWWGFMPRHRDMVTLVVPGIVTFAHDGREASYAAIDEGVLTKAGPRLTLAVRRAAVGQSPLELERIVREEYAAADEREAHVKRIIARLEADFLRCFPVEKRLP